MSWQVGLYVAAVLIPLAAFVVEILGIRVFGRLNAWIATAAIGTSFLLSLAGFFSYASQAEGFFGGRPEHTASAEAGEADAATREAPAEVRKGPLVWKGRYDWVSLGAGPAIDGKPSIPALTIPLEVYVDNLTVLMFLMVTFIATLIHVYSMGYMHDDPRYPRFFAYLSLFCFSMLGLVASANVFMIFIFWELVGVCSYLLIGFWYEEKKNADAANKAFITNRVGDVGMLMGLGLLWGSLGTFNISEINTGLRSPSGALNVATRSADEAPRPLAGVFDTGGSQRVVELRQDGKVLKDEVTGQPRQIAFWALTLAGLGIFAGCVGKSAQFPLHVWLPDAMAGPTPVSALIHAATMVAAGVYLVGRFFPVFTGDVLTYIAYTGSITLFIAASIAIVQTDYKKVLAYSTVSQLGFMMVGLGVGGWAAGLFHLITHACFKALLFLGAGSVFHSVHTYEMPVLGGLRRKMPITAYTMLAGTLAISGVPFFSGFYSKDAILASALYSALHGAWWDWPPFLFLVVGAAMTAFYMFRMWFLVFDGEPRGYPARPDASHGHDHGHGHGHDAHHAGNPYDHAHESPAVMTVPLVILAFLSIFVGWTWWFGLPIGEPVLEKLLTYGEPIEGVDLGATHWYAMVASILVMTAGVGLGILFYAPPTLPYFPLRRRMSAREMTDRFGPLYTFLANKWYFDELYNAALVRPTLVLAHLASELDRRVIDGLINGLAWSTEMLSRLEGEFDKLGVDRLVNLTGQLVYGLGDWSRVIQTGRLRGYLMFLAVALVGLFAGVFVWVLS